MVCLDAWGIRDIYLAVPNCVLFTLKKNKQKKFVGGVARKGEKVRRKYFIQNDRHCKAMDSYQSISKGCV